VPRSVHVRLDDEAERALRTVRSSDGLNDSEAVRAALREAARRRRREAVLREEIARIANDPAEIEEARRMLEELEPLSPDWPE